MKDKLKGILALNGKTVEFPVIEASIGPDVLDISSLYRDFGVFAYDPGFMSTASSESKITFADGDLGVLRYRGYDIDDLIKKDYNFLQISYLLLFGDLPDSDNYKEFLSKLNKGCSVPEQVILCIKSFSRTSHPMAILSACFSSLAGFYNDTCKTVDEQFSFAISAIIKVLVIVTMIYRYIKGLPFISYNNEFSYSKNFLNMMFYESVDDNNRIFEEAMNTIFVLHADHEQNASTSIVRLTGSTGSNVFACLSAGVNALWGAAHGGANEAVIKMLTEIGSLDNVPGFIEKVKNHEDRLMGFGHRVYKNYDPRARIMREICGRVLNALEISNDNLLNIAIELETIALRDQYFIDRKLYPNVDFYSGIILRAVGVPTEMFTVIFALSRTVGWISQWYEIMSEKNVKIGRPRQLYTGFVKRDLSDFRDMGNHRSIIYPS